VLLFDEPTAHLDTDTAALVCADLLRVTTGRTALVVTHRPEELPGLPRACLFAPAPRGAPQDAPELAPVRLASPPSS
jgi:ATP-binding cassette subfamily C protein CydCD